MAKLPLMSCKLVLQRHDGKWNTQSPAQNQAHTVKQPPALLMAPCLHPARTGQHLSTSSCPPGRPGRGWGPAKAQPWGWEPHSHFIPPPPQLSHSSSQLLVISGLHTHCTHVLCHSAVCSWDCFGTTPTPSCSATQHRNPGFIKLNLTQRRTTREINFKMFPLKHTLSKLCKVYRNQYFSASSVKKAIPPSRGLPSKST